MWVRSSGDVVTIGVTREIVDATGNFIFVELPEPGRRVCAGETIGTVETLKTVVDVVAPLEGVVDEVNTELLERPRLINDSPHGLGWIVKLRIAG
ncbi:MAG: glycine cleavage system protein H [Steroidobacteraceae bacterium]